MQVFSLMGYTLQALLVSPLLISMSRAISLQTIQANDFSFYSMQELSILMLISKSLTLADRALSYLSLSSSWACRSDIFLLRAKVFLLRLSMRSSSYFMYWVRSITFSILTSQVLGTLRPAIYSSLREISSSSYQFCFPRIWQSSLVRLYSIVTWFSFSAVLSSSSTSFWFFSSRLRQARLFSSSYLLRFSTVLVLSRQRERPPSIYFLRNQVQFLRLLRVFVSYPILILLTYSPTLLVSSYFL